jgi:hypothetical protein
MGPLGPFFYSLKNSKPKKAAPAAHPEQTMTDKSHDPNQMTGAAMIVRALIDHGVQHLFGYPGGAVLPIYDEIFQQSDGRAHSGAARAGRRPCGRRLCALDRQARRGAGDVRVPAPPTW